jgi:serine/threonine protein kinase
MLKYFNSREVLMAYQEATAYAALKSLQGYRIPFCYGMYDVDGRDGVMLLVEEIQGQTLFETLEKLPADHYDEFQKIFGECWEDMQQLHECGYAHNDIKGDNIMLLENGQAVFLDLEHTK